MPLLHTTHPFAGEGHPETDEFLAPTQETARIETGANVVPMSFEVLSACPGEGRFEQYASALSTIMADQDPNFVAVGDIRAPYFLSEYLGFLEAVDAQTEPSKVVPIINEDNADDDKYLGQTLERYAEKGITQVIVSPSKGVLKGHELLWKDSRVFDLIRFIRKSELISEVGVIIPPDLYIPTQATGKDKIDVNTVYDGTANMLELSDYGLTTALFSVYSYEALLKEMSKRKIDKPIIPTVRVLKPPVNIREVPGFFTFGGEFGTELPQSVRDAIHGNPPGKYPEILEGLSTIVGRTLIQSGATALHIQTNNQMRATERIVHGIKAKN